MKTNVSPYLIGFAVCGVVAGLVVIKFLSWRAEQLQPVPPLPSQPVSAVSRTDKSASPTTPTPILPPGPANTAEASQAQAMPAAVERRTDAYDTVVARHVAGLTERLRLNSAQVEKLKNLFAQQKAKYGASADISSIDPFKLGIESMLNPDQTESYNSYRREKVEQDAAVYIKAIMQGPNGYTAKLALTPQQSESVHDALVAWYQDLTINGSALNRNQVLKPFLTDDQQRRLAEIYRPKKDQ